MIKKKHIPYKWELIIMLWLAYFLNQGDRQIYNAVIPLIKADLQLSDVELGLVATVFTLVYGLLVPVGGYLGDFLKRKWIIVISLFVFSAGTLLTGFSAGLIPLIILRGITTGGGEAFYYPAATSLIGQYHKKTRATAMAVHQTSLYSGIIVSGFLAAYIGERFGWRCSFFTFGIAGIIVAIYLCFRMHDTPHEKVDAGKISIKKVVRDIFKSKTVLMLCLAFGGQVFVNIGYVTWMPTFYHEKFNLTLSTASLISMLFHFSLAFVGVIAGGKLSDMWAIKHKSSRIKIEFIGLLLGAPFIFLMGATSSLYVSCLALALFGFFRGVYDSNLFAALFDVIKPDLRSSSVGIMTGFAFLVGALAPLLLGIIKIKYGLSIGISSLSLFYVLGSLAVLIAIIFFFKKEYYDEEYID